MRKILYLLLISIMFLAVGCTSETVKTEEELKEEIRGEILAEQKQEEELKEETKEKTKVDNDEIKDINSIIEFVNHTDTNMMTDQRGEKLRVFQNYETHYFDFTGEGNDDVAIVTWEDDNNYLPVIFVTTDIIENEYYLINSDFRANEGDEFFCKDGFIINDDKENKSYDIAYNIGNEFIQMSTRYVNYDDITQVLQSEIDIKYIIDYTLEKLEGFQKFNVNEVYTYFDEKGNSHKYDDITKSYTFNEETFEFDIEETHNMETIPLEKLVAENFVIGTEDTLKTFETVYNEKNLEEAINYYYEKRQKFSKNTRIKFIEDYYNLTNNILDILNYGEIYGKDEVITDNLISTVTLNIKPIPEKMSSVFSVVKEFWVGGGVAAIDAPFNNDEYGSYTITCINSDMTKKINLMCYDKEVLVNGEHYYGSMVDGYVDVKFQTQEQMLEDIKDIVYPTVLINNLLQLNEFKHKDIWKTKVVIVPEKIKFEPSV